MEANHLGVDVSLDETNSPHVGWQMLINMRDGHGVAVKCPRPHHHHIHDGIHQPAVVEVKELMDRMCYLHVGNLCSRNGDVNFCGWFCNTLHFVYPA